MSSNFNRREFLGMSALATAGIIAGCSGGGKRRTMEPYKFLDKAVDGKELKAGLIGCGGGIRFQPLRYAVRKPH